MDASVQQPQAGNNEVTLDIDIDSRSERTPRRERPEGRRERAERPERRERAPRPVEAPPAALGEPGAAVQPPVLAEGQSVQAPSNEGEPRQRRSRDRYGRDRRDRGERPARDAAAQPAFEAMVSADVQAPETPVVAEPAATEPARRSYFNAPTAEPTASAAAPAAPIIAVPVPPPATTEAAPVAATAPAPTQHAIAAPAPETKVKSTALPQIEGFTLPLQALQDIARASGLEWVNSDAEKIAAVQAAIAAEPTPVHVPRERLAPVVVDEGPLILVETRRDLRDMRLPFEQSSNA